MIGQHRLPLSRRVNRPPRLPALDGEARRHMRELPKELIVGVRRLVEQPAPQITKPGLWPIIVDDAFLLATTGWVKTALDCGWHPLEVFGCVDGDDTRLGLAGRLDGRWVAGITQEGAVLRDDHQSIILRRNPFGGAIYLWEYGR